MDNRKLIVFFNILGNKSVWKFMKTSFVILWWTKTMKWQANRVPLYCCPLNFGILIYSRPETRLITEAKSSLGFDKPGINMMGIILWSFSNPKSEFPMNFHEINYPLLYCRRSTGNWQITGVSGLEITFFFMKSRWTNKTQSPFSWNTTKTGPRLRRTETN